MALLETRMLSVRFGGKVAVNEVDLDVEPGKLVGLIGPNGAGKTTSIDAVTGFVRCSGQIRFDGIDIKGMSPKDRARRGLARTWQSAELFDNLTVRENLQVAAEHVDARGLVREILHPFRRTRSPQTQYLEELGIDDIADEPIELLSHGQRKLVGVGRALASNPKLICMDEPAAGLDTRESEQFGQRIRKIADAGTAILLVDHDMGLVLSICDYLYVLDFGVLIAQGSPMEIRGNDKVIEAYLGRRHEAPTGEGAPSE